MGLKKTEQKEYAKFLYTEKNLTQKEIAEKADVTEKTLIKWIGENDGEWKKLKKSLLTTKPQQIKMLYDQLARLNDDILNRATVTQSMLKPVKIDKEGNPTEAKPEYDPIILSNVPTSKEADTIIKITNAINKLEGETSIGDSVNVGMDFCEFVREIDFAQAQKFSEFFDLFIRQQLQ
ncbi:hypothetical protein FNJ88_06345 [Chryseobacterium sp. SNU WT5]|uniref:hypothetical protein n=1 Tax=Chryseobacterium sp. SNU WT5 TaxID=2594269 RepID=UPI00117D0FCF|nr:hypothetical protein [Chryseobacterium sp. SNU WT5]QDP85202.1 hypothetical protein FNJ88_06345 [Chryseobacterium sp. SNU WT5]